MQVSFQQSLGGKGRITRIEEGTLLLQRPGKMRWDYTTPAGKIFLVDGKTSYYYNPATRKAERSAVKESDDLRVPLAFLMGRLDFRRDFREFRTRTEGDVVHVIAAPKSDKAPYTEVQFEVNRQDQISSVVVRGQDQSLMTLRFSGEKLGSPAAPGAFEFKTPEGAELVDVGGR
jgi:outer membrane lipoprotein carrier protein